MDDKTQTELEAAVYRRLVEHLRGRTDVQNIDMMNLAGFCRNCLSNWMKDAADAKGVPMTKEQSREIVYGEAGSLREVLSRTQALNAVRRVEYAGVHASHQEHRRFFHRRHRQAAGC